MADTDYLCNKAICHKVFFFIFKFFQSPLFLIMIAWLMGISYGVRVTKKQQPQNKSRGLGSMIKEFFCFWLWWPIFILFFLFIILSLSYYLVDNILSGWFFICSLYINVWLPPVLFFSGRIKGNGLLTDQIPKLTICYDFKKKKIR